MSSSDNPFEVLKLPKKFALDLKALETAFLTLAKQAHPDRATGNLELSAMLNNARAALKDPERRLDTLLELAGQSEPKTKKIPLDLAERFFEIQESENAEEAHAFRQELIEQDAELKKQIYALAEQIDWKSGIADALEPLLQLRELRNYIRSLIRNLEPK